MKYEIEIPEGRYCDDCPLLTGEDTECWLMAHRGEHRDLEWEPNFHILKDKSCPAYLGETLRKGVKA